VEVKMAEASPVAHSRRDVLDLLLRVSLVGWLASVLYPVLRYLKPLRQTGPTGPTRLTRAEVVKIEKDKFVIVPIAGQRVLVFEDPSGEVRALDAKCTHEGCTVRYLARDALIWCACHNGRFDLEGHVLAGPPPRPLGSHTVVRGEDGSITVAVARA
jgi:Rieske Fe-S protein